MGQQEIIDFLEKNKGEYFSAADLAENTNARIPAVTSSLRKIRNSRSNQVSWKYEYNPKSGMFAFRYVVH